MSKLKLHLSRRGAEGCAQNAPISTPPTRTLLVLGAALGGLSIQTSAQELEVYETFTAIGQGETRATNSLGLEDLELSLPGLALEKQIDVLPGVNVSSSDPYGFYEWGNDIRLRSFRIDQVAVTVDGVPMGSNDPRYGTRSTRVIDAENVAEIKVSQGAGDLSTPAYEALGGSIKYAVRKPTNEMGVLLKMTMGDFGAKRYFGRFDTGEIIPGLTAYVSGSNFGFKTRGVPEDSLRKHVDVIFNYEFEKGSISLQYAHNDRDDYDTVGLSYSRYLELETGEGSSVFAQNGYIEYSPDLFPNLSRWDYGDYSDHGRKLGPPTYIVTEMNAGDGVNAIYYDKWRNGRIDQFTRLTFDFDLSDAFKVSGNIYYQDKDNYGLWGVDRTVAEDEIRAGYGFDPSRTDIWPVMWYDGAGNPLNSSGDVISGEAEFSSDHAVVAPGTVYDASLPDGGYVAGVPGRTGRDEEFGGHRFGASAHLSFMITESNTIKAGGWYDYDRHQSTRPNYNFTNGGAINGWFNYDQFQFNNYYRDFETDVYMLYLQDTQTLLDGDLAITGGFKVLSVDRQLDGQLTNQQWRENVFTSRAVKYEDSFLPQLGFTYTLNPTWELFGNYSENMSAPDHGTMTGNDFSDALNPEYATNIDLGVRFTGESLTVSTAFYMIDYQDRVLAIPQPPGEESFTAGDTEYQNVGGVDSIGLEIGFEYVTPVEGLRLVGAVSYQKTTFQDDVASSSRVFITGDSPLDTDSSDGFYEVETGVDRFGDPVYTQYADIDGKDLGNTPEIVLNIEAIYDFSDFRVTLGEKYYDSVFLNNLNNAEIDSYLISRASFSWNPGAESSLHGFSATVSVENLFDEVIWYARSYTDNTGGQIMADRGRNITFTIQAKF